MSEIITESNNLKKGLILGVSMLCAVTVVFLASFVMRGFSSTSYISLDAASSIELKVNGFGKVKDVYAVNSSAQSLIQNVEIKGEKVEIAVGNIVEKVIENDESKVILLGADNKSDELKEKASTAISKAFVNKNYSAVIKSISFEKSSDYFTAAHDNNASIAKYELVSKICRKDTSLSREELCKFSVQELLDLVQTKNINLGTFFD